MAITNKKIKINWQKYLQHLSQKATIVPKYEEFLNFEKNLKEWATGYEQAVHRKQNANGPKSYNALLLVRLKKQAL